MDYFLNQIKLAASTKPPYTTSLAVPAKPGRYVFSAIATDNAGLSGVAVPVSFEVVAVPPVLSLSIPAAGKSGKYTTVEGSSVQVQVSRSGGDKREAVKASYQITGANVPGKDYQALSGTVSIPAGKTSAFIKVSFLDDKVADGDKTLTLRLLPGARKDAYAIGAAKQVKIQVLDLEGLR